MARRKVVALCGTPDARCDVLDAVQRVSDRRSVHGGLGVEAPQLGAGFRIIGAEHLAATVAHEDQVARRREHAAGWAAVGKSLALPYDLAGDGIPRLEPPTHAAPIVG